eukprot:scaffold8291_cov64-Phaeocystis_antarctica.AAC.8
MRSVCLHVLSSIPSGLRPPPSIAATSDRTAATGSMSAPAISSVRSSVRKEGPAAAAAPGGGVGVVRPSVLSVGGGVRGGGSLRCSSAIM